VTMRLQILRQTSIAGQPARVGDVVEVSDRDARLLLGSGKAQPVPSAPVPVVVQDPEPIQRKPRTRRTKNKGDS
jgi:hypothetical protein